MFGINYKWFLYQKTEMEKNAAKMMWMTKLKPISIEAVDKALSQALEQFEKTPPTIGEFLAICKPKYVPAHVDNFRSLPPPTNLGIASEHLAKMKSILKGNK